MISRYLLAAVAAVTFGFTAVADDTSPHSGSGAGAGAGGQAAGQAGSDQQLSQQCKQQLKQFSTRIDDVNKAISAAQQSRDPSQMQAALRMAQNRFTELKGISVSCAADQSQQSQQQQQQSQRGSRSDAPSQQRGASQPKSHEGAHSGSGSGGY